jgi:hypothetical protein
MFGLAGHRLVPAQSDRSVFVAMPRSLARASSTIDSDDDKHITSVFCTCFTKIGNSAMVISLIEMEDAKPDAVVGLSGEWIDLGVGNESPRHRGLRFPPARRSRREPSALSPAGSPRGFAARDDGHAASRLAMTVLMKSLGGCAFFDRKSPKPLKGSKRQWAAVVKSWHGFGVDAISAWDWRRLELARQALLKGPIASAPSRRRPGPATRSDRDWTGRRAPDRRPSDSKW